MSIKMSDVHLTPFSEQDSHRKH